MGCASSSVQAGSLKLPTKIGPDFKTGQAVPPPTVLKDIDTEDTLGNGVASEGPPTLCRHSSGEPALSDDHGRLGTVNSAHERASTDSANKSVACILVDSALRASGDVLRDPFVQQTTNADAPLVSSPLDSKNGPHKLELRESTDIRPFVLLSLSSEEERGPDITSAPSCKSNNDALTLTRNHIVEQSFSNPLPHAQDVAFEQVGNFEYVQGPEDKDESLDCEEAAGGPLRRKDTWDRLKQRFTLDTEASPTFSQDHEDMHAHGQVTSLVENVLFSSTEHAELRATSQASKKQPSQSRQSSMRTGSQVLQSNWGDGPFARAGDVMASTSLIKFQDPESDRGSSRRTSAVSVVAETCPVNGVFDVCAHMHDDDLLVDNLDDWATEVLSA